MVAKTTLTQNNNMLPVFNPLLIRETLNKMDRCMNRLQELQVTVSGGLNLSPRSTRNYIRTSLRCKQESMRIKNGAQNTSPMGKSSKSANLEGEWRQMSLPAMLVGETVIEILKASQFARKMVSSVGTKLATDGPKTPSSQSSNQKSDPENTELRVKRRKEKENKQQSDSPPFQPHRARSRINFEVSPPKKVRDFDEEKENIKHLANRVSPRNRPWARKTVLFPNPLFSSTSSHQQEFCNIKSPVMSTTPHKFRIKSPYKFLIESPNRVTAKTPSKFRIKSPHVFVDESRNRVTKTQHKFRTESEHKFLIKSPSRAKTTTPHKFRIESPHKYQIKTPPPSKRATRCGAASISSRTISPSRLAAPTKSKKSVQKSNASVCLTKSSPKSKKSDGLKSSPKSKKSDGLKSSPKRSAASKLRRSFSPSRLVTKLVLPLKSKKNDGLKQQRPPTTMHLPGPRF